MVQIVECPNCLSADISNKFVAQDRHYGVKGDFNLDICKRCGLVFLNPMLNNDELSKFYPEDDYYAYHMDFPIQNRKSPLRELIKKVLLLNEREEIKFINPGKILDIGCGNGWVLHQYKQKGWDVAGVEPSRIASEVGNKAGLNIYNGTLLDAGYANDEFDFIRSNHSFEHIYNPNEVLEEVHRILKPDGRLLIGIPNYAGINSKLAGKYWYYLGAPVHTFNYSPKNIKQLLAKHNFKVEKLTYVSGSAGILGSLQIYLNRKTGRKSSEGSLINSTVLQFAAMYLGKFQNFLHLGDCMEVIATKK